MSIITKKNNRFKESITISIILHLIIFSVLFKNLFFKHIGSLRDESRSSINAMMIDLDSLVQNDNIYKKSSLDIKYDKEQHENQLQQKDSLRKQIIDQKEYLKKIKKENCMQLQEITRKTQNQSKQAIEDTINKINRNNQKKLEIKTPKSIADNKKKIKSENNKRIASETKKKYVDVSINNFFKKLSSDKNKINTDISKTSYTKAGISGSVSKKDINNYSELIKASIESQFYDASHYTGKNCILKIKIASDGMLLDLSSKGGDHGLCSVALSAARRAKIPKPPSQAIYEIFKDISLEFRP